MAMTKIRSRELLCDFINERLAARKMEIFYIKGILEDKKQKKSKETTVLSKALIVMSYSHLEGFVKECVKSYLDYLNTKGIQIRELSSPLLASYIHSSLFQNPLSPIDAIEKIESMIVDTHESVCFNSDYMSDTESNLKMDVLLKIVKRIGMDPRQWESYRVYLDSVILKYRNEFAHGDNNFVDADKAIEISGKVVEMMQLFSTEIMNMAELKSYHN